MPNNPKHKPFGLILAQMEENVLPRGFIQRTPMDWPNLSIICVCGAPLVALGVLATPISVQCSRCTALDAEAQAYLGPPPNWNPPKIEGEIYYNPAIQQLEEWPFRKGVKP